jgi:hypothetical protein
MEKSKLEQLSDKMLSQFFIQLGKIYYDDLENNQHSPLAEDDSFRNDCDSVSTIFGLGECDWIDIDYIITMIDMNPSISDGVIENRPKLGVYTYEFDVHENVSQRVTYKHTSSSYSPETVLQIATAMEYNGDKSSWEGEHIDTDVYDSETTSNKIDKDSVRKIR